MEPNTKSSYQPLIVLVGIALLAAFALSWGISHGLLSWMHFFMGFFFCQFAMFKFFNLSGFVDGFQMYDLIAKKSKGYAYLYPFIELALGLAYLSFFVPYLTYLVTLFFMVVGTFGVIKALKEKLDLRCACMGTVLNVPLSTVTLTEDLIMGAMALIMLFL